MIDLWKQTFELFRRRPILWMPCLIAAIMTYSLGGLQRAARRWLVEYFATQSHHSVLGGTLKTYDWDQGQHRAMMFLTPIGFIKDYFEVCLFVAALIVTNEMVQALLDARKPVLRQALSVVPAKFWEILAFSAKYFALMGLMFLIPLTLSWATDHTLQLLSSRAFNYSVGLVAEACIAWLLVPAAMRLLRSPGSPKTSMPERISGTVLAVATSVAALGLEYLTTKAESVLVLDSPWQGWVLGVVNTFVVNLPEVILFIALTLLAIDELREDVSVPAELHLS